MHAVSVSHSFKQFANERRRRLQVKTCTHRPAFHHFPLHDLAPQERGVDCSAGDRCAAAEQEDEGDDFENAEGRVIIVLGA